MNDRPIGIQLALAAAAVLAVGGALALVLLAAFPYFYGESGSARYAAEHRVEAIGQVLLAVALLWVAWLCMRRSLSPQKWATIGIGGVAFFTISILADYWKTPGNARPIGDRWYAVTTRAPGEIDTIHYRVFYKRGLHYQPIEDLAAEYRFVPPDCLIYRGLKVSGRPLYAMCGYRWPAVASDTSIADSDLLALARTRPPF